MLDYRAMVVKSLYFIPFCFISFLFVLFWFCWLWWPLISSNCSNHDHSHSHSVTKTIHIIVVHSNDKQYIKQTDAHHSNRCLNIKVNFQLTFGSGQNNYYQASLLEASESGEQTSKWSLAGKQSTDSIHFHPHVPFFVHFGTKMYLYQSIHYTILYI